MNQTFNKYNILNLIYSNDHYLYDNHNCPVAYQKNVQVPVCPLCNAIIPGRADELPDIRVSRHIDSDCSSDTAVTRRKVNLIIVLISFKNFCYWKQIYFDTLISSNFRQFSPIDVHSRVVNKGN